jgi:hypothetical protein
MNSKSSSNSQRIIMARTEARLAELTAELLETSPAAYSRTLEKNR